MIPRFYLIYFTSQLLDLKNDPVLSAGWSFAKLFIAGQLAETLSDIL
jgi:hypothetical protein